MEKRNVEQKGVDQLQARLSESPDDDLTPVGDTSVIYSGFVPIAAYGTALYGRVDVVPGYLHIETMFCHFLWIPLLPQQTWVLANDPRGLTAVKNLPIRMSLKSVALVWLQWFLNVALVGAIVYALLLLGSIFWGTTLMEVSVGFLVVGLTYVARRLLDKFVPASEPRALELAELVGFGRDRFDEIRRALAEGLDETPEVEPLEVPCPKCGQKVLETSKICPRCEHRFRSNRRP
jgi:hypothetical protein